MESGNDEARQWMRKENQAKIFHAGKGEECLSFSLGFYSSSFPLPPHPLGTEEQ